MGFVLYVSRHVLGLTCTLLKPYFSVSPMLLTAAENI